jgi:sensor histidine kinase YesM
MPTKPAIPPTNTALNKIKLNDALFQWLLVPVFGITIPLATQMVDHEKFNHWQIKLSYLYTIGVAWVIYHGNKYLHASVRNYFNWYKKPAKKLAVMLFVIIFYTVPVSVLLLAGWYAIFENGIINWNVISSACIIILICVLFVAHVYETAFIVMESETEIVKNAQLNQAKAEAELEALKNQIDPHFIFNSLNTLSHLIENDSSKAKLFNDHLADVYRYILQNKARDLVLLSEEIAFIEDYFSLIKIRFEESISLDMQIDEADMQAYLIPPISLQTLVENAIKHNEYDERYPLVIQIRKENKHLVVSNRLRKKLSSRSSSKIGLKNLQDRYELITGKTIEIQEDEENFVVILPILSLLENEA